MCAQFHALACMRSRRPCDTSTVSVYRRGFRSTFFYSANRPQTISARWHHRRHHASQFAYFSDARCIFHDFPDEKAPKQWPDVTQRWFGVRFRSNLAWWPTLVVPTCVHSFVHLHACDHLDLVQPATYRSAGEGFRSTFFHLCQMARNFFHSLASPSASRTPVSIFFPRSMHFLRFSR